MNGSKFAAYNWLSYFSQIALTRLNRCYQLPIFQTRIVEFNVFCDASKRTYGAVVYCKFGGSYNTHYVAFIVSKSRIVGSKSTITIPKFELQLALTKVKLSKLVKDARI